MKAAICTRCGPPEVLQIQDVPQPIPGRRDLRCWRARSQLAKHQGAHVTAACGPSNLDLVRSLGADVVLDYTASPPDPLSRWERGNEGFDRVIDAVGRRKTSAVKVAAQTALAAGGRCVSVDDSLPRIGPRDLVRLTELAEQGALRPVIDRRFPLARWSRRTATWSCGTRRGTSSSTLGSPRRVVAHPHRCGRIVKSSESLM